MLKKHIIAMIVTSILAISAVIYMYSKNYISFESGLHITFAQEPDENYVENEFAPANTQLETKIVELEEIEDTHPVSRMKPISRSNKDTKVDEGRFFDDAMKVIETFIPLATVLIPIYFHQKNKKRVKASEA